MMMAKVLEKSRLKNGGALYGELWREFEIGSKSFKVIGAFRCI